MKKIGVILSGCGVLDGAEIHESVLSLLAIDRAGAQPVCLAPDVAQTKVSDHLRREDAAESRNVLVESARIARSAIRNLAEVSAADLDAVVIPGGYGAAINLSDLSSKGAECTVHPEVERLLREMLRAKKPIGALCIAPAMLARVLHKAGVSARLTIGTDAETAALIASLGQTHVTCAVTGAVVDQEHRIVTSPAYMLAGRISEVADGVDALVGEVLRLA